MANKAFTLKFWGVRGTLPTPGATTLRYGGNTSCIEVRCNDRTLILDAGSGIKLCGDALSAKDVDILISHTHIDHIMGLPFFAPLYDKDNRFRLWAGHLQAPLSLRNVIEQLMSPPLFPLTPRDFKAVVEYRDFTAGEILHTPGWQQAAIAITTLPLEHPDQATGYRVEHQGKVLCYITDYEHLPGIIDPALVQFVQDADCLVYDSTYSDEEFEQYRGWGHSTWQQAVRLADAAHVKTLVIFHHDPDATDTILDQRAVAIEKMRPGSIIAKEGLILVL